MQQTWVYKRVKLKKHPGLRLSSAEGWTQMIILPGPMNAWGSALWVCVHVYLVLCLSREGEKEADWWSGRGLSVDLSGPTLFSSLSACAAGCHPHPQFLSLDQMSKTTSCIQLFDCFLCFNISCTFAAQWTTPPTVVSVCEKHLYIPVCAPSHSP